MTVRKTFNGKAPKKRINAPVAVMLAVILILASSVLAVGIYVGTSLAEGPGKATHTHSLKGVDFK